ncbi:MAG: sulfatase-like hydrolase/transferase, partial [Alphaproteobacteria bacterium]|nr:sulfatase-like hydrolase/transferase [Alphaproteobacteria bacterium]
PAMIQDWRDPIGPNQAVEWEPGPAVAEAPAGNRPPNIVLIVADDLGWNNITLNGGGVAGGTVPTPNIDSIARSGLVLANGYSGSGTCAPSRAAMMSGRYPTRFGFEFTPMPPGMAQITTRFAAEDENALRRTELRDAEGPELHYTEMGMPQSEISMGNLLQDAGYHTIHIGKWHLGETNGMAAYDQGFDESLLMASGLYLNLDDPSSVEARNDFDPIDRFLWANMRFAVRKNGGPRFEPDRYLTDYFTHEAVKAIEANRNRPFFLYLAHWAPHTPLQATQEDYDALSHIEDHTLRVYGAMIRALDRGVGEVLDALKQNGLEENTLVIFTSDNGGAHYIGLPEINQPYRGWKATFFGGGIRVPLFMKWPAKIEAGQEYRHPVHHFDIYATAAAAAGTELPSDRVVDGRNLLAVLEDKETSLHDTLFWRSGHYQTV